MAAQSIAAPRAAASSSAPRLCGAAPSHRYRRSSTVRAPRKRTFLQSMEKFQSALATPSGAAGTLALAALPNAAMLGVGCCEPYGESLQAGGGDGRGNIGGGRGGNGGDGNNSHGDGRDGAPFRNAVLGVFALGLLAAAFPSASQAALSSPVGSFSGRGMFDRASTGSIYYERTDTGSGKSPRRARSKVMHVSCRGSTLVVPLSSEQGVPSTAPFQRKKLVEAPLELTERESRMLSERQYRVRESLLV